MFVGTSESVAMFVKVMLLSSLLVRMILFRLFSTGALFPSVTIIVKVCVALMTGMPLSTTFTLTVKLLPPCASVGVKISRPCRLLKDIHVGKGEGANNEKLRLLVGMS